MVDTTLKEVKQLKDPFIWCAANGSVLVADGGVPVEMFDDSLNWIKIWLDTVRGLGYNVDGWKVICGGSTTMVHIQDDNIILEKYS